MADSWDNTKYYADPSLLALKLKVEPDNELMLFVLEAVTSRFIGDVGRELHKVIDDVYYLSGDGGRILALPHAPVHGTPVILIDGVEVTDFHVGRRTGILARAAGWPEGLENVEVTYTHGYETLPRDVTAAVLEAAEAAYYYTAGIESVGTGSENVRFSQILVQGGATPAWSTAVSNYFLSSNGDGS